MMVPLKDIARVVNGLSLVAKEAAARRSADSLIKGALLSATDATGLTKGSLRSLETPRARIDDNNHNNHGDAGGSSSVVYFDIPNRNDDADAETLAIPVVDVAIDPPAAAPSTSNPDFDSQSEIDAPSTSARAPATAVIDVDGSHRRKPRERRVPSTPFSRAVG